MVSKFDLRLERNALEREVKELREERATLQSEVNKFRRIRATRQRQWTVVDLDTARMAATWDLHTEGITPFSPRRYEDRYDPAVSDTYKTKQAAEAVMYSLLLKAPEIRLDVASREVIDWQGKWEVE